MFTFFKNHIQDDSCYGFYRLQSVGAFLSRVFEDVTAQLTLNNQSHAFDGYEPTWDDDVTSVSCSQTLVNAECVYMPRLSLSQPSYAARHGAQFYSAQELYRTRGLCISLSLSFSFPFSLSFSLSLCVPACMPVCIMSVSWPCLWPHHLRCVCVSRNKSDFECTALSWNSTGSVVIVGYGYYDRDDLITAKAFVSTWNVDRVNINPNKPVNDQIINQNGATSGFDMYFATSTFGAWKVPRGKTHLESTAYRSVNPMLFMILLFQAGHNH